MVEMAVDGDFVADFGFALVHPRIGHVRQYFARHIVGDGGAHLVVEFRQPCFVVVAQDEWQRGLWWQRYGFAVA